MVQTVEPGTASERKKTITINWRIATAVIALIAAIAIGAALWLQGRVTEQQTRITEQQRLLDEKSTQLEESRRALERSEMSRPMSGQSSAGPGSQMPMGPMPGMGGMMHGMPGQQ